MAMSPGDITTKKCEIINYKGTTLDISNMVIEFNLFEDIFANSLCGNIVVADTIDLITTVPMIGEELLDIEMQTSGISSGVFKQRFYIYKLSERKIEGDRKQSYVLHFTTTETILNLNKHISKSFKGSITDTVKKVVKETQFLSSKKDLAAEQTNNNYQFISAYWTPYQILNFCAQRAVHKSGAANYFFYETNKGFEFRSISELVKGAPVRDYKFANADARTIAGNDIELRTRIVTTIYSNVQFDYMRRLAMGMYSSKLNTFDITTKKIKTQTFDYIDTFNKFSHLEKFPLSTSALIRSRQSSVQFLSQSNQAVPGGQQYDKFLLARNSLTEQILSYKINIEVPGRFDTKVGDVITLVVNNLKALGVLNNTEIIDDIYSGRYLITAIRHKVQSTTHTMYMEIVKDSIPLDLNK